MSKTRSSSRKSPEVFLMELSSDDDDDEETQTEVIISETRSSPRKKPVSEPNPDETETQEIALLKTPIIGGIVVSHDPSDDERQKGKRNPKIPIIRLSIPGLTVGNNKNSTTLTKEFSTPKDPSEKKTIAKNKAPPQKTNVEESKSDDDVTLSQRISIRNNNNTENTPPSKSKSPKRTANEIASDNENESESLCQRKIPRKNKVIQSTDSDDTESEEDDEQRIQKSDVIYVTKSGRTVKAGVVQQEITNISEDLLKSGGKKTKLRLKEKKHKDVKREDNKKRRLSSRIQSLPEKKKYTFDLSSDDTESETDSDKPTHFNHTRGRGRPQKRVKTKRDRKRAGSNSSSSADSKLDNNELKKLLIRQQENHENYPRVHRGKKTSHLTEPSIRLNRKNASTPSASSGKLNSDGNTDTGVDLEDAHNLSNEGSTRASIHRPSRNASIFSNKKKCTTKNLFTSSKRSPKHVIIPYESPVKNTRERLIEEYSERTNPSSSAPKQKQRTDMTPTSISPTVTPDEEMLDLQKLRVAKEIELLDHDIYLRKLDALKKERELSLQVSPFTVELAHDSNSRF